MSNASVSYSSVVSGAGYQNQNKGQRGGGGGGGRGRSKVIRNSNHQQTSKQGQNIQQNGQQQRLNRPQHGGTKSPGQGGGGGPKQLQSFGGGGVAVNPFQVFAQGSGANGRQEGAANLGALLSNLKLKSEGGSGQVGTSNGRSGQSVSSPDEEIRKLNINAIKRADPGFGEILTSASQVAVYEYDHETGNWTDSKTAGCFFIYKRTLPPDFGLCVLNRKGLKNLVLSFDKNSQVIPQKPNLLFRPGPTDGGSSPIKCLWFYKESDFDITIELLRSLGVHFDQLGQQGSGDIQTSGSVTSGNQIFSMLQNSQTSMAVTNGIPAPRQPNAISVEQLEQQDIDMDPAICMVQKSATGPDQKFSSAVPFNASTDHVALTNGTMGPSLSETSHSARMQMRTVEQLEKDMVPSDKNSTVSGTRSTSSKKDISNDLLATLGIKPTAKSSSSPKSSQYMTPASRSRSDSSRSNRKLTIDDLDGKLYDDTDEDMVREVVESLTDLGELLLLYENVDGKSEPQLVWRKRSNLQSRPASALIRIRQNTNQSPPSIPGRINTNAGDLNCLTKNQLLQAMNYLLQTDSDFISKIHEAYVRSLQTAWSAKASQS